MAANEKNEEKDEDDDVEPGFDDGKPKNPKVREEDKLFVNMGMGEIIGLVQPKLTKESIVLGMLKKFDSAREEEMAKGKVMERRRLRKMSIVKELRAANKQLLGKLHSDQLYLERLLVNPHLNNSSYLSGGDGVDIIQKRVI